MGRAVAPICRAIGVPVIARRDRRNDRRRRCNSSARPHSARACPASVSCRAGSPCRSPSPEPRRMTSLEAIRAVVAAADDEPIVASLGHPAYDLFAAGDRPANFYTWGSMGLASSIGLGLAVASTRSARVCRRRRRLAADEPGIARDHWLAAAREPDPRRARQREVRDDRRAGHGNRARRRSRSCRTRDGARAIGHGEHVEELARSNTCSPTPGRRVARGPSSRGSSIRHQRPNRRSTVCSSSSGSWPRSAAPRRRRREDRHDDRDQARRAPGAGGVRAPTPRRRPRRAPARRRRSSTPSASRWPVRRSRPAASCSRSIAEEGSRACTVLGTGLRATAAGAALANGTAAHALDYDDMCFVSLAHPERAAGRGDPGSG